MDLTQVSVVLLHGELRGSPVAGDGEPRPTVRLAPGGAARCLRSRACLPTGRTSCCGPPSEGDVAHCRARPTGASSRRWRWLCVYLAASFWWPKWATGLFLLADRARADRRRERGEHRAARRSERASALVGPHAFRCLLILGTVAGLRRLPRRADVPDPELAAEEKTPPVAKRSACRASNGWSGSTPARSACRRCWSAAGSSRG